MNDTFIAYEVYKWLHLLCIMLFIGLSSVMLWYGGKIKVFSILTGIASVLILVTGLGLMANLGIKHAEPWPLWIKIKLGVWLFLTILVPVVHKRLPKIGKMMFWLMYLSFALASYSAIYKVADF